MYCFDYLYGFITDCLGHVLLDVFPYDDKLILLINRGGMGWGNVENVPLPKTTYEDNKKRFDNNLDAQLYRLSFINGNAHLGMTPWEGALEDPTEK